jgi:TPR repeat protein
MNIRPLLAFTFIGLLWGAGISQGYAKEWNKEPMAVLQQGAEAGDVKAQYYLGTLYCEGKGVARDDTKAVEWLARAAEQGNPDARYVLA